MGENTKSILSIPGRLLYLFEGFELFPLDV
jgi:hypothetical protein